LSWGVLEGFEDASREDLLAVVREVLAVNAALSERVAAQDKRIAELERLLSRNSGNSSMPPSTDGLPGRTKPAPRAGGKGGSRGKRKGARGAGLEWSANPTDRKAHYPSGACGCGSDLAGATDEGVVRSHQVHDVPLVTVTITQHDLHRVRCGCGRVHVAARPQDVQGSPANYGPNLRALVVYLMIFQHIPVHRCARLIADLTGARPSAGFIHSMLTRAAEAVKDVVALIRTLITVAYVVGFDETVVRVGKAGTKKYVLSASTERCTLFGLGGRDLDSFRDFAVLPAFTGIAVHDRYVNYDNEILAKQVAGHQLCTAHLLRDIASAGESHPDHRWPEQATDALRGLIHAANTARSGGRSAVPADIGDPLILQLRRAVRVGLAQIPRIPGPAKTTKQTDGRLLLECLRDREHDVLRFTTDTRIWPTNNTSERDLRPEKTQQKISGRLQSEDITRHRLTIRSYTSTAAKHGINIMTALRDAITGNPWAPPIPATT
jgi:transposase